MTLGFSTSISFLVFHAFTGKINYDFLALISVTSFYCWKHCSFDHAFFVGQSTAVLSVTSFSAATFVESSAATLNVGSPSGEINRESSSAANTLESFSAMINMVSPSGTKDIPLSLVTTRTLNVGSYTAVSFTSAAMHSVSQFAKTSQVTTALTSTTETGVEPTFASTVKPTITSSLNGKYVVITEWLQLRYVQLY